MAELSRSSDGLANLQFFFPGKTIVYVEGSCKGEEFLGFDATFWRVIFKLFYRKNTQIFPKGGKLELLKIADEISDKSIGGVFTAIDRDHDDIKENLRTDPCVIYTYGYSFENDALMLGDIESLLENIFFGTESIVPHLIEIFNNKLKQAARPILVDVKLARHTSVLSKESPERYMSSCPTNGVKLDCGAMRRDCLRALADRRERDWSASDVRPEVMRRAQGRLIIKILYQLIRYYRKKYMNIVISFDEFMIYLVRNISDNSSDTSNYYQDSPI